MFHALCITVNEKTLDVHVFSRHQAQYKKSFTSAIFATAGHATRAPSPLMRLPQVGPVTLVKSQVEHEDGPGCGVHRLADEEVLLVPAQVGGGPTVRTAGGIGAG